MSPCQNGQTIELEWRKPVAETKLIKKTSADKSDMVTCIMCAKWYGYIN